MKGMNRRPSYYCDVEACVEETLRRVGWRIVLGTPLGLGKANHLVNEFFRRAREDPQIDLRIFTALTLGRPGWKSELERRFVEPLAERLFGGYPELEYLDPFKRGELPENIRVTEFYFQPGIYLDSPLAQRTYVSSNYSHAVRDLLDAGVNVLAQLIGKQQEDGPLCSANSPARYSLSCNPDLTLDLVPRMREMERKGKKVAILGQVNRELPFMYGDAAIAPDYFDAVLDDPRYEFPLFGPPNRPVSTAEYLLALHISALIRDGGTLQIGIGSLGHAVTYLLQLRHERNELYRELLAQAGVLERFGSPVERVGGTGPFEKGLYASSEMLIDGFLELYRSGVLRRRVYDHPGIQRLLNEGLIGEEVTRDMLYALVEAGVISARLSPQDFALLREFGILRPELKYEAGSILVEDGTHIPTDLADPRAADDICRRCLGGRLRGGHFAHACFFLGPRSFYDGLRRMERAEREQISMTSISYVNELYGQEKLKRLQRKDARFINSGLIVTLAGAVASDGLEDGRVVSGVGGQYNFVAMAHALEDGRSLLMIPSTEDEGGNLQSNIRWSYGHITIPRHLRDLVVSEYGIAELRGHSDEEVARALVEIADARFQDELLREAKRAGKISEGYHIPDHARNNRPERLEEVLAPYRERGLFQEFPFGTEMTEEELVLKKALTTLQQKLKGQELSLPGLDEIRKTIAVPESAHPYLERMGLEDPQDPKEMLMQRAIVYALASVGAI
jgi:acyl-CoA hydrolase